MSTASTKPSSAIPHVAHPVVSIDGEEPEVQVIARPRVARAAVDGERQNLVDMEVMPDMEVPDVEAPVKLAGRPGRV